MHGSFQHDIHIALPSGGSCAAKQRVFRSSTACGSGEAGAPAGDTLKIREGGKAGLSVPTILVRIACN